ncbi:hypothetical protein BDA99DRAFT_350713 [Phascolomyces articulosus]|uniref:UBX domain-containing protein n=1 Tax=Phascolomyces articulosus TaxID=60185 RepID=A0AAD5PH92_9FUNG|nr:hypothetical protein BDA99DRAFT_350713 [Phascolomyces articulosus]
MSSADDDKLAQLLSLGFDIDVCRAALLQNDSVQSATEWILGNETQHTTVQQQQPILSLRPESLPAPSSLAASPSPPVLAVSDQVPITQQHEMVDKATSRQHHDHAVEEAARMRNESLKMSREAKMEKKRDRQAREQALAQIKEDRERQKLLKGVQNETNDGPSHTTTTATASTSSSPSTATKTAYEKAQQEIKRQKRLDREAKYRALKEIQQDRENMKLRHATPTHKPNATTPTKPSSSTSEPKSAKKSALVQFKLSNGTTVRQSFQASAYLSELYAFASEKELSIDDTPMGNDPLRLISAFPRREFTEGERVITVQEAGFIPNVSLNVVRPRLAESSQPDPNKDIKDEDTSVIMQDVQEESREEEEQEGEEDSENEDDDDDVIEEDEEDIDMGEPPGPDIHHGRLAHNPNWNWGTQGYRLVDGIDQGNNNTHEQQSFPEEEQQQDESVNRQNMLSAIERRGAAATTPSLRQQQQNARGKAREIRSLKDTCAISVAAFLTQPTVEASHRIKNLVYASSKVGELLLSQLMYTRKLERSSIKRLADHCYLQNVCLDSYVYATDSLLQELSLSNSSSTLSKLSLKGCDVITDSGIRYIEGLKNLEYLDITDPGFHSLLEHTHFQNSLQVLLLDGCHGIQSKDTLLLINNAFSGLVSLGLASTGIGRQTVVTRPKLVHLQSLDISHTSLTDQDAIQTMCAYKALRELKLVGCNEITLRGLGAFAQNLRNLEVIQFPSHERDLDGVLPRYAELPLRHLDLTSFQVTDEGADAIARTKKLQYLSLDGTKITDEGVSKLSGLTDLRKLFLDRTTVSDEGISQLIGLTKLDTLSLSRTQVSNALLVLLGVQGLQGMVNLTNMNLDYTNVSKQCLRHLKNLEHLKPVRLMGIEREEDEEEEQLV